MSTMGEVYFLKQIDDLKKGRTKYFFLDQEDYECWLDKIEQHNLLVVKKFTSSNYRIYLNNEKNREIVQKILIRKPNQRKKRSNYLFDCNYAYNVKYSSCFVLNIYKIYFCRRLLIYYHFLTNKFQLLL